MIKATRRGFILGLASTFATPSIVTAANLMPLRGIVMPVYFYRAYADYAIATDQLWIRFDKARVPLWQPGWKDQTGRMVGLHISEETKQRMITVFDRHIGDPGRGIRGVNFILPHLPEDHDNAVLNARIQQVLAGGA